MVNVLMLGSIRATYKGLEIGIDEITPIICEHSEQKLLLLHAFNYNALANTNDGSCIAVPSRTA